MNKKKSKFALDRRLLLKSMGASIALPLLDIMDPEFLYGQSGEPLRVMSLYSPNGLSRQNSYWIPSQTGANYTTPNFLLSSASLKSDFSIVSRLRDRYGEAGNDGAGDHARAASSYFTGQHVNKSNTDIDAGISYDQVISAEMGTPLKSLNLAITSPSGADSGYAAIYKNLSWFSDTVPNPPLRNPLVVFNRLFGDQELDAEAVERRNKLRKSILDTLVNQTKALQAKLGSSDKAKLDQYLTGIRELEGRIDRMGVAQCTAPTQPGGIPGSFFDHIDIMAELAVKAFECDLTRMIIFSLGNEGENRSFQQYLGFGDGWHDCSHHSAGGCKDNFTEGSSEYDECIQSRPQKYDDICRWMFGRFPQIVQKFKDSTVGNKSLLDSSIITFGSAIRDGNAHDNNNIPFLIAGKGNGLHTPGRHIQAPNGMPIANIWLTLIQAMGINLNSFGDSNATFDLK